jgi:exosortase/archaeosortase
MRSIAKWRCFGMLALAKPNFFCFIKLYFNAAVRQAFYSFVIAVAER